MLISTRLKGFILFSILLLLLLIGRAVGKDEAIGEVEIDKQNTEFVYHSQNTIQPITPLGGAKTFVLGVQVDNYRYLIEQYNWNYNVAYAVMREESRFNPEAINYEDKHRGCSGSYGLMQLGCVHFGKYGLAHDNWHIPEVNIRTAYLLYKEFGWKIWGPCTNGKVRCW